jgi:5-methylcytosine-specific restriction endonuclease McrA
MGGRDAMRIIQMHMGDPPEKNEHQWKQVSGSTFRLMRYVCLKCRRGPYTESQIHHIVPTRCYPAWA